MPTEVIMPQMGESIAEGTITKWLVRVGDRVERDQPLFEISTDKVDAEIPSPGAGTLIEIVHQEGETVSVDSIVAMIGEAGEQPVAVAAPAPAAPSAAAPAATTPPPAVGAPPSVAPAPEPAALSARPADAPPPLAPPPPATAVPPAPAAAAPSAPAPAAPTQTAAQSGPPDESDLAERLRTFSSPVVRNMAAEHGVELSRVPGTGIHGRVTKKDFEAYLESGAAAPEATPVAQAAAAEPAAASAASPASAARTPEVVPTIRRQPGDFYVPPYTEGDDVEIEPMSKIRQITAAHMIYSKATSAHVTTVFHMDLSRVARARQRAKAGFLAKHGTKLTYMPFIFKAVANALTAHRKLNAAVDGTNIVYKKEVNIGMAVALDWGLLVPVIRNADRLNLVGLAKSANDLAERARAKRLSPDEIQGGTFTVTNPGVFGSLFGTPIINQPQVAILGLGAIEKRPVVVADREGNDTIAIKMMAYFAITYDHRLVDGADADHFMNHVKKTLAQETWSELDAF